MWLTGINLAFHLRNFKFAEFLKKLTLQGVSNLGEIQTRARAWFGRQAMLPSLCVPSESRATREFRLAFFFFCFRHNNWGLLAVYKVDLLAPPGLSVFHGFVAQKLTSQQSTIFTMQKLWRLLYFLAILFHTSDVWKVTKRTKAITFSTIYSTWELRSSKIKQLVFVYKIADVWLCQSPFVYLYIEKSALPFILNFLEALWDHHSGTYSFSISSFACILSGSRPVRHDGVLAVLRCHLHNSLSQ